jgi:hypothetical protein
LTELRLKVSGIFPASFQAASGSGDVRQAGDPKSEPAIRYFPGVAPMSILQEAVTFEGMDVDGDGAPAGAQGPRQSK